MTLGLHTVLTKTVAKMKLHSLQSNISELYRLPHFSLHFLSLDTYTPARLFLSQILETFLGLGSFFILFLSAVILSSSFSPGCLLCLIQCVGFRVKSVSILLSLFLFTILMSQDLFTHLSVCVSVYPTS